MTPFDRPAADAGDLTDIDGADADGEAGRGGPPTLIPLNLVFDYPVHWTRYKVLRDLIQNFYDAIGHRRWHADFSYSCADDRLCLHSRETGFSFEWLLHIGASTKRDRPGQYAGYFGEGFKIASLCALRDHGWTVSMRARDWRLKVTTVEITIDGQRVRSLAYRVWTDLPMRDDTRLWVTRFSASDRKTLEAVLPSFYYEQNPLFGECLWSAPGEAIWTRSACPKPEEYPSTSQEPGPGIVFSSYQARGSLELPLIFCSHTHRTNDRERSSFYRMDVMEVISSSVRNVPADVAAKILERLSGLWYRYPRKRYDFESWHATINTLARAVGRHPAEARAWRERHPDLLVAVRVRRKNLREYNRRRQALDWLHRDPKRYRLVQDGFAALGYPSLEEACERRGGFSVTRPPRPGREQRRIELLENIVKDLCSGFFGSTALPRCEIIMDERAVWMGMAICVPRPHPVKNSEGLSLRFELPYVALKSSLLIEGSATEALTTYLHELCHQFGGDRSAAFSGALTELLGRFLTRHAQLTAFEQSWDLPDAPPEP